MNNAKSVSNTVALNDSDIFAMTIRRLPDTDYYPNKGMSSWGISCVHNSKLVSGDPGVIDIADDATISNDEKALSCIEVFLEEYDITVSSSEISFQIETVGGELSVVRWLLKRVPNQSRVFTVPMQQ
jgi:hypothetical protein